MGIIISSFKQSSLILHEIFFGLFTGPISNQGNMLGTNKAGHASIAGTSATQVFNAQTQIRLGNPTTLATSSGHILTSPTLLLNPIQVRLRFLKEFIFLLLEIHLKTNKTISILRTTHGRISRDRLRKKPEG